MAEAKLTDYLLDPGHEQGGPKARALARFLGYGPGDAERLRAELLQLLATAEPVRAAAARFPPGAVVYRVEGAISGPNGQRAPVRSFWQVDHTGAAPRLTSAFPICGPLPEEPLQSGSWCVLEAGSDQRVQVPPG